MLWVCLWVRQVCMYGGLSTHNELFNVLGSIGACVYACFTVPDFRERRVKSDWISVHSSAHYYRSWLVKQLLIDKELYNAKWTTNIYFVRFLYLFNVPLWFYSFKNEISTHNECLFYFLLGSIALRLFIKTWRNYVSDFSERRVKSGWIWKSVHYYRSWVHVKQILIYEELCKMNKEYLSCTQPIQRVIVVL